MTLWNQALPPKDSVAPTGGPPPVAAIESNPEAAIPERAGPIQTALLGVWPRKYVGEIGGNPYSYPHNFLLETSHAFGWPLALLAFLGQLILLARALFALIMGTDALETVMALSCLGYLMMMQVSGNLFDSQHVLLIAWLWVFHLVAPPPPAQSRTSP